MKTQTCESPNENPDVHFTAYVGSTDVTIKENAFILESIIGGGEFGRVLGNTKVNIKGGQIGVGANQTEDGKPKRYPNEKFVDPNVTPITNENALAAKRFMKPMTPMLMSIKQITPDRCQQVSKAVVQITLLTVRHGLAACLVAVQAISRIRILMQMVKSQNTAG